MKPRSKHSHFAVRRLPIPCALALAALIVPTPMIGEELGRLFFTPERRQTLDRQRQLNMVEQQEIPEDPTLTINGVVTRSGGKRTVWVNGVAQDETNTGSTIALPNRKDPARVIVQGSDTPPANARVGDTVNRSSGETTELLNGGTIRILKKPAQ